MLFNSLEFLIFLPIVFTAYWLARRSNLLQNMVLLLASCIFYAWVDWRFLFLIGFTVFMTYATGRVIGNTEAGNTQRKTFLTFNIVVNLVILGFFKYYNFFAASFSDAFHAVGINLDVATLQLVLPVGISFYTFKAISYSVDLYNGKMGGAKSCCFVVLSDVLSSAFGRSYRKGTRPLSSILEGANILLSSSCRWGKTDYMGFV